MANPGNTIIKFTENYEVQDEHAGTSDATKYKKGQRKSFPDASAHHFISRGVAHLVKK